MTIKNAGSTDARAIASALVIALFIFLAGRLLAGIEDRQTAIEAINISARADIHELQLAHRDSLGFKADSEKERAELFRLIREHESKRCHPGTCEKLRAMKQ
jgi:hypothetical protein